MTLVSKTISILLDARAQVFAGYQTCLKSGGHDHARPRAEAWARLGRVIKYVREQAAIQSVREITGVS